MAVRALLRCLRRFLHGRLAGARQYLAAIGDLADHLADGDPPAAALEVLGVGHVDEALAVVVAHALHPILLGSFQRAFGADPLCAEPAHLVEAAPSRASSRSALRSRSRSRSYVRLDVHIPVVVAHVVRLRAARFRRVGAHVPVPVGCERGNGEQQCERQCQVSDHRCRLPGAAPHNSCAS